MAGAKTDNASSLSVVITDTSTGDGAITGLVHFAAGWPRRNEISRSESRQTN